MLRSRDRRKELRNGPFQGTMREEYLRELYHQGGLRQLPQNDRKWSHRRVAPTRSSNQLPCQGNVSGTRIRSTEARQQLQQSSLSKLLPPAVRTRPSQFLRHRSTDQEKRCSTLCQLSGTERRQSETVIAKANRM